MRKYLITITNDINVINKLSAIGELELVSETLNVYSLKTNHNIDKILMLNGVISVREEGTAILP